jgi:hypothetical protein
MVEPLDIWRAAKEMVKHYGDLAVIECAMRVDDMNDRGDTEGEAVWKAIRRAAKSLIEDGPPTDVSNG